MPSGIPGPVRIPKRPPRSILRERLLAWLDDELAALTPEVFNDLAELAVLSPAQAGALLAARARVANGDARQPTLDVTELPNALPIFAQMLGEFEVRIGGRRVEWIRRKDALLFKYLLLKPSGRASRSELCEAFWPAHDRQQASQNLRTTCCNIRAALRRSLPESRVDVYFRADGRDVVLCNPLVVSDITRFNELVSSARDAMNEQRFERATQAFEAARALYRGPLIVDPPNAGYESLAKEIDENFAEVQRHLAAMRRLAINVVALRAPA